MSSHHSVNRKRSKLVLLIALVLMTALIWTAITLGQTMKSATSKPSVFTSHNKCYNGFEFHLASIYFNLDNPKRITGNVGFLILSKNPDPKINISASDADIMLIGQKSGKSFEMHLTRGTLHRETSSQIYIFYEISANETGFAEVVKELKLSVKYDVKVNFDTILKKCQGEREIILFTVPNGTRYSWTIFDCIGACA